MEYHGTSWKAVERNRVPLQTMKHNGILWNIVGIVVRHHGMPRENLRMLWNNVGIIEYHGIPHHGRSWNTEECDEVS